MYIVQYILVMCKSAAGKICMILGVAKCQWGMPRLRAIEERVGLATSGVSRTSIKGGSV